MNTEGNLNLRLNQEEQRRWELMMKRIRARFPQSVKVTESAVHRELLGFSPPELVMETERMILSHGTEYPKAGPDQAPGGRRKRGAV